MKAEIFRSLKQGLPIGKNGELISWGAKLNELKACSEVYSEESNRPTHIFFGTKEVFPNIKLALYTPFDTLRNNDNKDYLFHVGQNLNANNTDSLVKDLTALLGIADEASDLDGIYRRWEDGVVFIEVIPRSHHGSDWNAIITRKKNCL